MKKILHIKYILFALLVIYSLQGVAYTQGSLISQGALFLFYIISGVFFVKVLASKHKKSLFIKAWTALLIINVVSYLLTGNYSNNMGMFKGVLMSLLSFYPFYYLARNNKLRAKHLVAFLIVMIPVSISSYYFNRNQILSELSYERMDIVNNAAYMFVGLIPFVFLIRKSRILSIVTMLVLMFFIVQGAKRGAIVVGGAGLVMYIYYQMRTVDKKYRARGYFSIGLAICVLGYFAYDMFMSNEFLMQRIQQTAEGNLSGRDRIYSNIFNGWADSNNFYNLLFGYGFAGSRSLSGSGHFAHNDWLELLSNLGLFGVSIYLVLFLSTIKILRKSSWDIDKKVIFITIMGMWFATTLFSMGYTSMSGYMKAMMLGYLLGSGNREIV